MGIINGKNDNLFFNYGCIRNILVVMKKAIFYEKKFPETAFNT